MTKPEGRHFSAVWYTLIILAVICSLPLEYLPWWPTVQQTIWWIHFARNDALLAFGMFLGAEFSAPDVKEDYAGTMTNWIYSKVHEAFWRILIGVWLSLLITWRVNPYLGGVFALWLPIHYWREGVPGPMDRLFRWLGARLGIKLRTW